MYGLNETFATCHHSWQQRHSGNNGQNVLEKVEKRSFFLGREGQRQTSRCHARQVSFCHARRF